MTSFCEQPTRQRHVPESTNIFHHPLTNLNATEFMQQRRPVGLGPSSNTWPRCASQRRQDTAVLRIPRLLSASSRTFSLAIGAQKLGQPVPESNFVSELKRAVSQQMQRNNPLSWKFQ